MRTLLVANRGEIARRIIRTAREMGIRTVAVYSDPDRDAPHVHDADTAVRLPGGAPAETYLRIDLLIEAARRTGADAVHPGYGFLSENAAFARACTDAGLIFVGPPADTIEQMGSKLAAKALMEKAGVPILPGYEVRGDEPDPELRAAADQVGWPVLVKASFGGGGRGMRVVRSAEGLREAVDGAGREAASAFGDGTVFLERYVERPRHVEIQVLADQHGTVTALFERECSIQRRHQKIIEEAPSPAVDPELRAAMSTAAVTAAATVGYVGAGTVEFLLTASGEFFFLEMNTRLQVEHPVTELITGLDLVRLQLDVAVGHPLPAEVTGAEIRGHAVEARLYAEDAAAGWLPASGTLTRFELPEGVVRVDAGYRTGSVVGTQYDPMLAKVIAWGRDRAEAVRKLSAGLAAARLHGVTTNRDLLLGVLRHPEFAAGDTDTHFFDRHDPASLIAAAEPPGLRPLHAVAAVLALLEVERARTSTGRHAPLGWANNALAPHRQELHAGGETHVVTLEFPRSGVSAAVDGVALSGLRVLAAGPELVDLELDGVRQLIEVHIGAGTVDTDGDLGSLTFEVAPRLPEPGTQLAAGSLVAPMPGAVVRLAVELGARVAQGQTLLVLEAMKMEHVITAPAAGVVTQLPVGPGDQVDAGVVLAVVEAEPAADQS